MTSVTLKWPRIPLSVATLSLFILVGLIGGANSSASPSQQTPPPPAATPQPTEPILLTDPVPDPKQAGVMWFAPTGHTLRGAFLDYWNKHGGLAQFGYPLTEEFFEPVGADNKLYQVQYFERNRFELHPENKGTQYEVLLGALGLDFRKADPLVASVPNAQYFSETGHNLSGKFKEYWETHGGLFVHGYPITEAVMERSTNGKEYLVQWFERSRFELHPENAGSPYEVLLGLLGRQLSEKKGFPYGWYPLFGHAPDFSWVAGDVWIYNPDTACLSTICGCALTRIDGQLNVFMQMVSADRPFFPAPLEISRDEIMNDTMPYFVFFGRKATQGEKYFACKDFPSAPGYFVTHSQRNPVRQWQLNPAR